MGQASSAATIARGSDLRLGSSEQRREGSSWRQVSGSKRRLIYGAFLGALIVFLTYGFSAPGLARHLLENGHYTLAAWHLRIAQWATFYNNQISEIVGGLNQPLEMKGTLLLKGPDQSTREYPIEALSSQELEITHRDKYKLSIVVPRSGVYVYVFQRDLGTGQIQKFFPDPEFTAANPLQSNQTYQMPADNRSWFQLDEISPARPATGQPVLKSVHVVASGWKAEDIENLYEKIRQKDWQTVGYPTMSEDFIRRLQIRTTTPFAGIYYATFRFNHEN